MTISKNFDNVSAACIIFHWENGNGDDATGKIKNNVANSLTTADVDGVTVQYFNGKPAHSMTDSEFFVIASPNTELEGLKPSAQEMTFIRKLTFELTGEPTDILDQDKFVAHVVNHATDDQKVLHLDEIFKAVDRAWRAMYPEQELDETVQQFAYFITTQAIINYHKQTNMY